MLKFVLRDGFDAVEDDIHETLAAERDMALYGAVPHAEVMRSAKKSLRRRAVEISKPQAGNTRLCRSQTSINP